MDSQETIESLRTEISGDAGFMSKVFSGKGFDDEAYQRMVFALGQLAEEWQGRQEVPKSTVALIFWLDKAMEAYSYNYRDEVAELLRYKAMEVHDLLEDIFNSD